MPLHALRKRLRLIRYYSAARPSRPWSRARDAALAAALLLAWPATWLCDVAWTARSAPVTLAGFLTRLPDGRIVAAAVTDARVSGRDPDVEAYGSYVIELSDEEHGWPFASSAGLRRGTINVQLLDEERPLGLADLPPGSPIAVAIERELVETGSGAAASLLWGGESDRAPVTSRVSGWLANGIVWSMALLIAARLAVGVARVVAALAGSRRFTLARRRVQSGRCAGCGYDLRGSTFGERCPECGALL